MKYDKFFELAKKAGIEECELKIRESYSLSFSLFHGEVENYESNNGYGILARGLINGKFGVATCDVWNNEKAEFLINEIVKNAKVIESDDPMFIFKGSPKYKRINVYNKELDSIPASDKLNILFELEKEIKQADEQIKEVVSVDYAESRETFTLINSHGLKLNRKSNICFMYGQVTANRGEQTKSGFDFVCTNDIKKIDIKELAKRIAINATEQLGGEACQTGKYKTVLSNNVMASLINAYLSSADAEEVQKHTSLFEGKVGTKIASSKVTIEDRPHAKTLFASGFDDEGVATYNKPIIKKGVLQTYLYNLTTAAKEGVSSTGNAAGGAKMGVSPAFVYFKPGKKSLDELFEIVKDGVYITDVNGLHAGLDPQTGNFSLQSSGFLIKDGKKDHPLDIITVSGNLLKLFKDIQVVGSDERVSMSGVSTPSVIVKSLSIGGK